MQDSLIDPTSVLLVICSVICVNPGAEGSSPDFRMGDRGVFMKYYYIL